MFIRTLMSKIQWSYLNLLKYTIMLFGKYKVMYLRSFQYNIIIYFLENYSTILNRLLDKAKTV